VVPLVEQTSRRVSTQPTKARQQDKRRIVFVDVGRALAALLVFYSHIAHPWVIAKGEDAPYIDFIEALTSDPMRMDTQGIGQIAVPFFFLVSGFVVTPIALRQGQVRFALNRFVRVYLPMLFVVALTALALLTQLDPPSTGQSQELNPLTFFTNVTLANYLIYPQIVLIPVAWTMIVEVTFYALLIGLLPVMRRSVWLAIAVELTFVFVVLMSCRELGQSYFLFSVSTSYLPILIIGQIIWATSSQRIPLWLGGVFGGTAWSLYVLADLKGLGRIDDSYNLALAFAVICFLMGMFAEPKLKQRRFWTELSERSYSIYLLHMLVSFVLLQMLRPAVPFPIALVVAVAGTFAVVELSYRFVEKPSHRLARRLSYRRSSQVAAVPVGEQPTPTPARAGQNDSEVTVELAKIDPDPAPPARRRPNQSPSRPFVTANPSIRQTRSYEHWDRNPDNTAITPRYVGQKRHSNG
jgi:peptidoglycan/LPS O-acetylase OafA/YrhL